MGVAVDRFAPLVRHVTRRYRLSNNDFYDVNQFVWLRLLENIDRIREPRALAGWIVATGRNEALRVVTGHRRLQFVDAIDDLATERTAHQEAPAGPRSTSFGRNVAERFEMVWQN